MRIDKFLKVSRLIKRREIAKELCLDGDIIINGKPAKPMTEVKVGDELELHLGKHIIQGTILEIRDFASKIQAEEMFKVVKDEIKC